jgi:hypothetical protein
VKFVATDAPAFLEYGPASAQQRRFGHIARKMALRTRGLNVLELEHWAVPVFNVAVGSLARGAPSLALVTDRAAEFIKRVPIMVRMVREWQWKSCIAWVFDRRVTTGTAVYPIQLRNHDLPNLYRNVTGIGALFGRGGAGHFVLNVLSLPIFPLAVLVFVKGHHDESTHKQAKERKPGVKLSKRGRIH